MSTPIEARQCRHCGSTFTPTRAQIYNGVGFCCSRSCAAKSQRRAVKHGHANCGKPSPTYNTWVNMKRRCHSPSSDRYYMYGARGISVCLRWRDSFADFLADMGERPDGMTLDRIDGNGNYEPGNCRWATPTEQAAHTRHLRRVSFRGKEYSIAELSRHLGIYDRTLTARINKGWTEEQLALPLRRGRRP